MRARAALIAALLLVTAAPSWSAGVGPSIVRGLLVTDTRPNQITISWNTPAQGSPTSYQVFWSTTNGLNWEDMRVTKKNFYTLNNTDTGTTYLFAVSAKNKFDLGPTALITAKADFPEVLATSESALEPYKGLGFWIDMYSWRKVHVKGKKFTATYQPFTCDSINEAASYGARTLFIQTAMPVEDPVILDPEYLAELISCAKKNNLYVVAWYYPQLLDVNLDFTRALASAKLPGIDGFGLDIESRKVGNVYDRNKRLVELSDRLHQALPNMALSAITYTPYNLDEATTWPQFPWAELAQNYAIWQPMTYWSSRKGELAHGFSYTQHTIRGLRTHLGANARINIVGAPGTTAKEVNGMIDAMLQAGPGIIGGGLYQWSQMSCAGKNAQLRLNHLDGSGNLRTLSTPTPKYTKFCQPAPIDTSTVTSDTATSTSAAS